MLAKARGKKPKTAIDWDAIPHPVFVWGNRHVAHRDPAGHYHEGVFRVFYSHVRREPGERYYCQLAVTKSTDLVTWAEPEPFTPEDLNLNYCGPGNIIRYGDQWLLCAATYPPSVDEPVANQNARIFKMASDDLEQWGEPELLRVKGPEVPVSEMGRMIDPCFVPDKDHPLKWWCFFKQSGAGMSYTYDFETWTYYDKVPAGENACVLIDREADEYVLIHAPRNGIGIKRSKDLLNWRDLGVWTLGQSLARSRSKEWQWAQGRLTAGHVLDLRGEPSVGKYVLFYHGDTEEGVREQEIHGEASLAVAWSDDLLHWSWPGKRAG